MKKERKDGKTDSLLTDWLNGLLKVYNGWLDERDLREQIEAHFRLHFI